jgi:hypothetical protein
MTEGSLVHDALVHPTADRATFLARACAGRPDLRSAVEALLTAHDRSGAFLAAAPVAQLVESDLTAAPETNNQAGSTGREGRDAGSATADAADTTGTAS